MKTSKKERSTNPSVPTSPPRQVKVKRPAILGRERDEKSRRDWIRERLGITDTQLVGVRKITPILMQAVGGLKSVLEALEMDDSPDAILFTEKWQSLSASDQDAATIEEVCIAAGLTTRRLLEVATGAINESSQDASKLIIASSRAKVIQKMSEGALTQFGEKDREMFLKGKDVDWFPAAKGIVIDNRTQNNSLTTSGESERSLPPPKADNFLLSIQTALRPDLKQIEAPLVSVANTADIEYIPMMGDDVV